MYIKAHSMPLMSSCFLICKSKLQRSAFDFDSQKRKSFRFFENCSKVRLFFDKCKYFFKKTEKKY